MKNFNRKAITTVVGITLLLLVSISSAIVVQKWSSNLKSQIETTYSETAFNYIKLKHIESQTLYVENNNNFEINYTNIKIDNKYCNINGTLEIGINEISLNSCILGVSTGVKEVIIESPEGFFSDLLLLETSYNGNFTVSFEHSTACPVGFVKLYALESFTNSHVEIPSENNYTYSLCIKHDLYTLTTSCSGNYSTLFYLDGVSNAHAYTANTSSLVTNWQDICMGTLTGSSVDKTISSSDPGDGSACIGSFDSINNEYGTHMGDCDAYPTRVWVNVH